MNAALASLLLGLSIVAACGDDDAGICSGSLLYFQPGCQGVEPRCVTGGQDACTGIACSCSGESIRIGCGYNEEPFAAYGECPNNPLEVVDEATFPTDAPSAAESP